MMIVIVVSQLKMSIHFAHDIIQSGALSNFIQNQQNQDRDMRICKNGIGSMQCFILHKSMPNLSISFYTNGS
jgi:hypothetical protein